MAATLAVKGKNLTLAEEQLSQQSVHAFDSAAQKCNLEIHHSGMFTYYQLFDQAGEEVAAARLRLGTQDLEASLNLEIILVRPDYRGKGLGRRLMNEIIRREGYKWTISLNVAPVGPGDRLSVKELVSFYESFGFQMMRRSDRRMVRPGTLALSRLEVDEEQLAS